MTDNNVTVFPGTNPDLSKEEEEAGVSSEEVLEKAIEADFDQVFVVGITKEGDLGLTSNVQDVPLILYLLYKAEKYVVG